MKGLILSITAGQGHNQTALVLDKQFKERGVETEYLDVYGYINPHLSDSVNRIYLMSTKSIPKIYGGVYRLAEKRNIQPKVGVRGMTKLTNSVLSRKLINLIKEKRPDFIICTHIFAALLVTYISSIESLNALTVGIVTDFTVHPYWEDSYLDYYILPDKRLVIQGMKKGFPENRLLPLGIPIDPKFMNKHDKAEAKRELGIDSERAVLVMSGSMGFGNIVSEIRQLDKLGIDFGIVTICGRNKKLKERIDALKTKKKIYNHGFTKKVDLFMDACDCIITKPGGLTTSEALAKQIPMLMNNPIPGQEDRNVEFLLNAGAAMKISRTNPLDEAVYQMFISDEHRALMRENMRLLAKPTAAADLVDFVINKVNNQKQ